MPRQHEPHHRREAEDVGLEHRAHHVFLSLFDGAVVAPARVVDQDVDAAEALLRRRHGARARGRVDDVSGSASPVPVRVTMPWICETLRAVTTQRWPWASTRSASARPKPAEHPVTSQPEKREVSMPCESLEIMRVVRRGRSMIVPAGPLP
jgi:hypothetical protein